MNNGEDPLDGIEDRMFSRDLDIVQLLLGGAPGPSREAVPAQPEAEPEEKEDSVEDIDDFERQLAREDPELARAIVAAQETDDRGKVSKKQERKDRITRLEGLTKEGRTLFEVRDKSKDKITVLDQMRNQCSTEPMSLLARSISAKKRIEVRIRVGHQIGRIATGSLKAFDKHCNLVMHDVNEVALVERFGDRTMGNRVEQQKYLPSSMVWRPGGLWPYAITNDRVVMCRCLKSTYIKAFAIVLIRMAP